MNSTKQTYRRYSVLIRHAGFIDLMAVSIEAAIADIEQAYSNPEVITWTQYEAAR
jgi:hypothetical protein